MVGEILERGGEIVEGTKERVGEIVEDRIERLVWREESSVHLISLLFSGDKG